MVKLCRVTKVKVFHKLNRKTLILRPFQLQLVYVFNFDLFEFSAAILEKGLLLLEFIGHHVETKKRKITWLFKNFSVNLVTSQQMTKTNL